MPTQKRSKRDLRPVLVFLNGDLLAVPIPLEREEVTLGRALEADVRINDKMVSRKHAQIKALPNPNNRYPDYQLTDLQSASGTLLNGENLEQEILQNGDKITIGNQILRFEFLDEIDREYQKRIRRLLAHDDLTGLLSSRSFFSELRRESGRAKQKDKAFCVLMMDLDYFKNVNDTFGHLTGSRTIEEIGNCITKTLRTGDAACRFGGEEFAAFLLDATISQALVAAERIRKIIETQEFTVIKKGKAAGTHKITISIGVSNFPDDSRDPIELVEMADSALYQAKRLGRNQVCAYRDLNKDELEKTLQEDIQ